MFVICTDLIFGFIGLLSAQVCSIKAGLMAGNVAVADETAFTYTRNPTTASTKP